MITSRTISTISYNSIDYLNSVLHDLIKDELITFYVWIEHFPEEDEEKKHIHLFIVPNKRLDTDRLIKRFEEPVSDHEKPLGVIFWKTSNFTDWYLYGLHDKRYLLSKGMDRKYYYNQSAMCTNCPEYFHELVSTMDLSKYNGIDRFVNFIKNGGSFSDACRQGLVPVRLISSYHHFYDVCFGTGEKSYVKYVDHDTGEILKTECVGGSIGGTFSTRGPVHPI